MQPQGIFGDIFTIKLNIMKNVLLFPLLFVLLLSACDNNQEFDNEEEPTNTISGETGDFVFDGYAPLSSKPLRVYYHYPDGVNSSTPILMVFHGGSRNAKANRDDLIDKANEKGLIIIAPEFSAADFSLGDEYILGNVFVDGDNPSAASLNPESEWTFSYVEPLFDHVKNLTSNQNNTYHALGFSAGAQFLHRLLIFKPAARIDKAVVAAAGWYTMPDTAINFPYGVKVAMVNQSDLDAFYSRDLWVIVGQNDNDPNAPRRNPTVDVQGTNRLDRADYFVNESRNLASAFVWQYQSLPNTAHEFDKLASFAVDNIF